MREKTAVDEAAGEAAGGERCPWCLGSALYIDYHDSEWGVPCRDERTLFEMLNLEGAQAGLSWITILSRRDAYRRLFHGFDPVRLAAFDAADVERLAAEPGIVRHRGKIAAVAGNARALLAMHEAGETLTALVWGFVDGEAVQNRPPVDGRGASEHGGVDGARARAQGARLHLRRPDHRLRLHAGGRSGQRPPRRLPQTGGGGGAGRLSYCPKRLARPASHRLSAALDSRPSTAFRCG